MRETRRTAVVFDFVAVLVFVGIGRSAHGHAMTVGGVVSTAWPFVTGLFVSSMLVSARWRSLPFLAQGPVIAILTVGIAMVLRVLFGQGTAVAFVFVALGFLGAAMLGWRSLVSWRAFGKPRRSSAN